jgi:glycosyltransferase involved in cell wall biosynthesis
LIHTQIVIPCFNESHSILKLWHECLTVIDASQGSLGFILVNNGSNDGSDLIFKQLVDKHHNIKIVTLTKNRGYGGGILAGLESSSSTVVGWTHADLQTPLEDCLHAASLISHEISFVKGWRMGRSLADRFFSQSMGFFETALFRVKLREINAQPTLFTREFYETWENVPLDFSLDLYALVMATKRKVGTRRIEVEFRPREFGESKWNTGIRSKVKFIRRTGRYSIELRKLLHENL